MSKQGIEGLEIEQHGHKLRYLSEQYKLHLSTLTISIKSLLEKSHRGTQTEDLHAGKDQIRGTAIQ